MVRTLTIDIWGEDWYIESTLKGDDKEYAFPPMGNYRVVGGKIAHLHNYMLSEERLKGCAEFGGSFLEHCSFVYTPRDKDGELVQKDGKVIEGDFIDALVFIYKELEKKAKNG